MRIKDPYIIAEIYLSIIGGGAAFVGIIMFAICEYNLCNLPLLNIHLNEGARNFSQETVLGLICTVIIAPIEIYSAKVNWLEGRNITNLLSGAFCIAVSYSIMQGVSDVSAIGGYLSVGVLSFHCFAHTSKLIKARRIKNKERWSP